MYAVLLYADPQQHTCKIPHLKSGSGTIRLQRQRCYLHFAHSTDKLKKMKDNGRPGIL